jgi:hypothetical protein
VEKAAKSSNLNPPTLPVQNKHNDVDQETAVTESKDVCYFGDERQPWRTQPEHPALSYLFH